MLAITVLIGFFSGIISGMGIGGGTVLIPALSIFLNISQQNAQGVNLLYFIPTAVCALFIHIKNKNVDFKTAFQLAACGVLGAVFGALLANKTDSFLLKKLFAVFLLLMGFYEILKKDKQKCKK